MALIVATLRATYNSKSSKQPEQFMSDVGNSMTAQDRLAEKLSFDESAVVQKRTMRDLRSLLRKRFLERTRAKYIASRMQERDLLFNMVIGAGYYDIWSAKNEELFTRDSASAVSDDWLMTSIDFSNAVASSLKTLDLDANSLRPVHNESLSVLISLLTDEFKKLNLSVPKKLAASDLSNG
jgi:hypothetical protein